MLAPEPPLPPVTASFRRRARDSYNYFRSALFGSLRYPHYRSHRPTPILQEGIAWGWKLTRDALRPKEARFAPKAIRECATFLFPLQLSSDYQIRTHSLFPDMESAATYVIESFAANAPADVHLILKSHPLDPSLFSWGNFVARLAKRLGIESRLHFVDGGDLESMVEEACGLVCVNSTSATLALARDKPVCTVGEAIYDIDGLTHQGHLDSFWANPTPPQRGVYSAFRRVLVDRCLVRGGLASESATEMLVESILARLEIIRPVIAAGRRSPSQKVA